jgi:hypothetical protein
MAVLGKDGVVELAPAVEALLPDVRQSALLALAIAKTLPDEGAAKQLGPRLASCTLYAGGLCRRARRAETPHHFRSLLGDAATYFDDSGYFIELLIESGVDCNDQMTELQKSARSLIERLTAIIENSRKK